MGRSIEMADRILNKIDELHASAIDQALIGTLIFGIIVSHPRATLQAINTYGIGGVYQRVKDSNKDLLFSKK